MCYRASKALTVTSPHSPVTPVQTTGSAFVAEVVIRTPSPWKSQGAFVTTSIRSVAPTTCRPTWFVTVPCTSATRGVDSTDGATTRQPGNTGLPEAHAKTCKRLYRAAKGRACVKAS